MKNSNTNQGLKRKHMKNKNKKKKKLKIEKIISKPRLKSLMTLQINFKTQLII